MQHPNNSWKGNSRKADSKWEGKLANGLLSQCEFHPPRMHYATSHTYQTDFRLDDILIEAKGRFMDSSEARKYLFIREYLQPEEELVFLFMKPQTPMPHSKKRRDGTRITHAEWADKHKFRWFTEDTISELLK